MSDMTDIEAQAREIADRHIEDLGARLAAGVVVADELEVPIRATVLAAVEETLRRNQPLASHRHRGRGIVINGVIRARELYPPQDGGQPGVDRNAEARTAYVRGWNDRASYTPDTAEMQVTLYGGPGHGATPKLKAQPARIEIAGKYVYARVDDPETGESLNFYAYIEEEANRG